MNKEIKALIISKVPSEDAEWILSQAKEDLEEMSEEDYISERLDKKLYGWNHPMFNTFSMKQDEQDDYILTPFEVEEGVIDCIACGSKKVISATIQTRAADEPMTTVAHCTKCKTKWSQNN